MNTLIIYASKTGTTEKCANEINRQLKNSKIVNILNQNENYKSYYEQNIPQDFLDNAIIYDTFGGEMDMQKQKGFDKFITKIVSKNTDKNKEIKILNENIESFIKLLKKELEL